MSDFRRLRELHEDDAIGAAFRSADMDGPETGADTKLLAALGVGVSAIAMAAATAPAATTAAAGAAGAAGTAGAAGGSGLLAKVGGGSLLAKWVAGSVLVVSTSVVGTMLVESPKKAPATTAVASAPASPKVQVASPPRTAEPVVPAVEEPAPAPPAVEEALPAPVVTPPRVRSAARPASSPREAPMVELPKPATAQAEAAPSASAEGQDPAALEQARGMMASARSLAPELSELDHVRSLLAAGRASNALDAVDRYRRAFPKGILMQESEVLRLDALVRLGERDAVEREGRAFLEQHPQSPQAARVRALLLRNDQERPRERVLGASPQAK
ncbi:hypothetical protein LVJ94_50230 [Pendulispora rubella]|uniref:Outer membrane protein assembly factor BamD n=1 Tax=Pendulispora rubella TaxID=2741070 RepID=A0ABZ2L2P1_9BACT